MDHSTIVSLLATRLYEQYDMCSKLCFAGVTLKYLVPGYVRHRGGYSSRQRLLGGYFV